MSEQPEFKKVPLSSTKAEESQLEDVQGAETTIPQEDFRRGTKTTRKQREITLL